MLNARRTLITVTLLYSAPVLFGQSRTTADLKKMEWLLGYWNRTNGLAEHRSFEQWEKVSDTEWKGLGITLSKTDTLVVEKIKLVLREKNVYYVADVPDNKEPVHFKLTEISNDGFVCENPEHDFPQKIVYRRTGTTLKATISGGGKPLDYIFEKQ
jgi:hypothetical protein